MIFGLLNNQLVKKVHKNVHCSPS